MADPCRICGRPKADNWEGEGTVCKSHLIDDGRTLVPSDGVFLSARQRTARNDCLTHAVDWFVLCADRTEQRNECLIEAALGVQEAARLDRDLSTAIRESAHQQDQIVQERERVKQLEGELAREVDRVRRANRETAAAHQMFHDTVAIIRANIGHALAPGWVLSDAVADLVSQRDVERAMVASQKGALEALTDRASRLIAGLKSIAEARTQCSCDSGLAWDMGGTAHVVLSAEGVVQDGDTGRWSKPTDDQPGRYDALVVIGMSLLDTLAHDCTPTRGQRTKLRQALESATAGTPGPLNVRIAELEAEVRDLSGKLNRECERADFWKRDAVARGATA